jgi:hypothetical protein
MKDPKQVLQQKEAELARVRKEIDSLNTVAPLLADDDRTSPDDPPRIRDRSNKKPSSFAGEIIPQPSDSERPAADAVSSGHESSFLNALKRAM